MKIYKEWDALPENLKKDALSLWKKHAKNWNENHYLIIEDENITIRTFLPGISVHDKKTDVWFISKETPNDFITN